MKQATQHQEPVVETKSEKVAIAENKTATTEASLSVYKNSTEKKTITVKRAHEPVKTADILSSISDSINKTEQLETPRVPTAAPALFKEAATEVANKTSESTATSSASQITFESLEAREKRLAEQEKRIEAMA